MTHLNVDKNKLFTFPPEVSTKKKKDMTIQCMIHFWYLAVQSQQCQQNKV